MLGNYEKKLKKLEKIKLREVKRAILRSKKEKEKLDIARRKLEIIKIKKQKPNLTLQEKKIWLQREKEIKSKKEKLEKALIQAERTFKETSKVAVKLSKVIGKGLIKYGSMFYNSVNEVPKKKRTVKKKVIRKKKN